MSEHKHVWIDDESDRLEYWRCLPEAIADLPRYTLTSGPEWDALMERARAIVSPMPTLEEVNAMDECALDALHDAVSWAVARGVLRDLLAYFDAEREQT